uniref:RING-type domain-containing protein n=1 Tax=Cyprinus carpio carpio TaxID=630221 RepID=A0A8C1HAJ1_CYPCA
MGAALFSPLSSLLADTTTMITPVDISRHFQCPMCKNLLTDPVSTTCGHTFCKDCLDKHISRSEPQCPLCQEPVTTKPSVNKAIEALLQEFHQTHLPNLDLFCGQRDTIPCDVCDEHLTFKAVKSCLICSLSFCDEHLKPHQSMARFKGHKLVSPVEKLDQRACNTHGRPLELYCRRDERCICTLCVKTGGDVIPVETERDRRQAIQQNTIEVIERMISQREDKLKELEESAAKYQALLEKEQQEIKEVFAALMEALRKTGQVLLAPLEDGRRCLEKEMDEKTQQIQKDILKYKEAIESLNRTKNEEDDILFIQSYPSVPAEFSDDWTLSIDTELNFGTMRNTKAELIDEIETHLKKLCAAEIRRIHSFSGMCRNIEVFELGFLVACLQISQAFSN